MNMSNTGFGFAHSSFECSVDQHGEKYKPVFQQGMLGFGIDAFIELFSSIEDAQGSFEFPSHIKIDVDGNEEKIINGAINTLSDNRLKTLLVELDFSRSEMVKSVIKRVEQCGLSLTHRPDHGMGNAIFYRNNV